jgi:hypothetical protein
MEPKLKLELELELGFLETKTFEEKTKTGGWTRGYSPGYLETEPEVDLILRTGTRRDPELDSHFCLCVEPVKQNWNWNILICFFQQNQNRKFFIKVKNYYPALIRTNVGIFMKNWNWESGFWLRFWTT